MMRGHIHTCALLYCLYALRCFADAPAAGTGVHSLGIRSRCHALPGQRLSDPLVVCEMCALAGFGEARRRRRRRRERSKGVERSGRLRRLLLQH